jgi:adenylate cyclase class 2
MSFEVEVKYRAVDHDHLIQRLVQMGAAAVGPVNHEDIYLSHPARDFSQTNEAFRIRRLGQENRITYKGPRRSGPTKTREEIEITMAEGPDQFLRLLRLLENLGFRPVATIRKRRESFHLTFQEHELEIALDVAEGLGAFAEIEALASGEADLPAAQQAVLALADTLGLTEVEPRSYLRMVLENGQKALSRADPGGFQPRHGQAR